ncbi:MAG: thioesterase family protein [Caulobacteraceae bacterium]
MSAAAGEGSGLARPRLVPIPFAALPPAAFRTPRSIRFSDCDPAGIAYTARLVDLMNGAVEDLFPARLGLSYHAAIRERRLGLGYGRVDCDFFRPAEMGDAMIMSVLVDRVGAGSIAWRVHIHHGEDEAARGQLITVTTSLDTRKPIPVPAWLRAPLDAYRHACGQV